MTCMRCWMGQLSWMARRRRKEIIGSILTAGAVLSALGWYLL